VFSDSGVHGIPLPLKICLFVCSCYQEWR